MYEIAWVIPLIPFESAPSHPGTDRTLTHHLNPSRPQRVKSIRLSLVDRASIETDASKVRGVLEKYLSNERPFAASIPKKQPYDKLLLELIGEGKESLEKVLFMMVAHNKLAERGEAVMAILREMVAAEGSGMSCMYVPDLGTTGEMDSALPSTATAAGDYGNVRYLAQQLLDVVPQESFEDRVKAFREQLEKLDEKTLDLSTAQEKHAIPDATAIWDCQGGLPINWCGGASGELPGTVDGSLEMELLVEAVNDSNPTIQKRAMHAYAYWLAAPSRVCKLQVLEARDPSDPVGRTPSEAPVAWAA
eukprot:g24535.t1